MPCLCIRMSWLMFSNAFDMSKKMANVMSLDLLSFAVDMSFSKCNIGPKAILVFIKNILRFKIIEHWGGERAGVLIF